MSNESEKVPEDIKNGTATDAEKDAFVTSYADQIYGSFSSDSVNNMTTEVIERFPGVNMLPDGMKERVIASVSERLAAGDKFDEYRENIEEVTRGPLESALGFVQPVLQPLMELKDKLMNAVKGAMPEGLREMVFGEEETPDTQPAPEGDTQETETQQPDTQNTTPEPEIDPASVAQAEADKLIQDNAPSAENTTDETVSLDQEVVPLAARDQQQSEPTRGVTS